MHRAEIIRNILNIAFADEEKGASTLVSFTLTSKFLHPLAVDVLWHTLPNIKPLLNCMPPDIWRGPPNADFELQRPLRADDLSRCHHYAPLVRRLGYSRSSEPLAKDIWEGVSPHTMQTLLLGGLSLPNLRHISWHGFNLGAKEILLLSPLLPLGIVEIDFSAHNSDLPLCALFSRKILPAGFRSLRTLRLLGDEHTSFAMPDGFVRGLDLEEFSFTIGQVSPETLRVLAGLPNLHTLCLAGCTNDAFDLSPTMKLSPSLLYRATLSVAASLFFLLLQLLAGFPPYFTLHLPVCTHDTFGVSCTTKLLPSLRHIGLFRVTLSVAASLLSQLTVPLESIEFSFGSSMDETEETYLDFCSKLANGLQHRALKSLKLCDLGGPRHPFSSDILCPLFKFSQLECLHLNVPSAFSWGDQPKFIAWAAAWPLLRDLQLQYGDIELRPDLADLVPQDLIRIGGGWPHLESLSLSLDMRCMGTSIESFWEIEGHPSLTSLRVHGSPFSREGDPFDFGMALPVLFPRLVTFQYCGDIKTGDPVRSFAMALRVIKRDRMLLRSGVKLSAIQ
ncbi:hypothetical protein BDN72DRAFT_58868 [Pluteus cervinus]|uniref:Uncharacterized protein n=1 Tax=Pluteus cervinus TaxID=181527 RepID=A0ACD3ASB3_9AGAR|nr:hypothetical protein BDN72DRAFT_58868 [Pluteus cervinus]